MKKITVFLLALTLLAGCGENSGYEFSDYHCNLVLDNSKHLDATLATAMDVFAPGVFCTIGYIYKGGNYYTFRNNHGLVSERPFNGIDLRLQNNLRVGQNNGLIVGFGNLDNPPQFFAYDQQCPNCFSLNAIPMRSYPLVVDNLGIARCSNCRREYNLNTGGNIITGQRGRPLIRYRASTSGVHGILKVY